jgi:hypothetical protein
MQSTQTIPFSNVFPPELNHSILEYLPPDELEKHIECADVKDINLELFLQKPAKKILDQSWESMVVSLLNTIKYFKRAVILPDNSTLSTKAFYFEMCSKNIDLFKKFIHDFAGKLSHPEQLPELHNNLLRKTIFHFFIAACKADKADLLDKILSHVWRHPDVSMRLLEYFLDADAAFYKVKHRHGYDGETERSYRYKEEDWYRLLCLAIRGNARVDVLSKLIDKGRSEGYFKVKEVHSTFNRQLKSGFGWLGASSGRQQPKEGSFYVTPLLLAFLFKSDDEVITLLTKSFPDEVVSTLEMLRQIQAGKSVALMQIKSFLYHLTGVVSVGVALATKGIVMLPPTMAYAMGPRRQESTAMNVYEGWEASPEEAVVAKIRMLNLLDRFEHKKEITLTPEEKKLLFNEVKKKLANVKTPDECLSLYDQYIDAYYINNHYWSKTDSVACFLWRSASTYTATKKEFIGLIRNTLYDMVKEPSYCFSFDKPSLYVQACQNIFAHPAFSDEHDKQGVNPMYKNKLKERLEKLLEVSAPNLSLC